MTMMTTGQRMTVLLQDMVLDRQRYNTLSVLLEEHRTHILARKSEQINAANDEIMKIYSLLAENAQRRHVHLETLGVEVSVEGIHTLFNALPGEKKLKIDTLLNELQKITVHCQQLNERNGLIIQMQQDTLNRVFCDAYDAAGIY